MFPWQWGSVREWARCPYLLAAAVFLSFPFLLPRSFPIILSWNFHPFFPLKDNDVKICSVWHAKTCSFYLFFVTPHSSNYSSTPFPVRALIISLQTLFHVVQPSCFGTHYYQNSSKNSNKFQALSYRDVHMLVWSCDTLLPSFFASPSSSYSVIPFSFHREAPLFESHPLTSDNSICHGREAHGLSHPDEHALRFCRELIFYLLCAYTFALLCIFKFCLSVRSLSLVAHYTLVWWNFAATVEWISFRVPHFIVLKYQCSTSSNALYILFIMIASYRAPAPTVSNPITSA